MYSYLSAIQHAALDRWWWAEREREMRTERGAIHRSRSAATHHTQHEMRRGGISFPHTLWCLLEDILQMQALEGEKADEESLKRACMATLTIAKANLLSLSLSLWLHCTSEQAQMHKQVLSSRPGRCGATTCICSSGGREEKSTIVLGLAPSTKEHGANYDYGNCGIHICTDIICTHAYMVMSWSDTPTLSTQRSCLSHTKGLFREILAATSSYKSPVTRSSLKQSSFLPRF